MIPLLLLKLLTFCTFFKVHVNLWTTHTLEAVFSCIHKHYHAGAQGFFLALQSLQALISINEFILQKQ